MTFTWSERSSLNLFVTAVVLPSKSNLGSMPETRVLKLLNCLKHWKIGQMILKDWEGGLFRMVWDRTRTSSSYMLQYFISLIQWVFYIFTDVDIIQTGADLYINSCILVGPWYEKWAYTLSIHIAFRSEVVNIQCFTKRNCL